MAKGRVGEFGTITDGAQAATSSSGTVLHLARLLAESICFGAAKLCSVLLEHAKAHFAFSLVVLVLHLDIVLGETLCPMAGEELAVATIEDVHFGVSEFGVLEIVDGAIAVADEFGHARGSQLRVFAMEDEQGPGRRL